MPSSLRRGSSSRGIIRIYSALPFPTNSEVNIYSMLECISGPGPFFFPPPGTMQRGGGACTPCSYGVHLRLWCKNQHDGILYVPLTQYWLHPPHRKLCRCPAFTVIHLHTAHIAVVASGQERMFCLNDSNTIIARQ